ncbi:MAG: outer membrane protein assembly factor BamD [Alphaproteobacteria bacterium]|nr:outer membrane protein assembly factor BamD [Alphaproteobacteria bacterium]
MMKKKPFKFKIFTILAVLTLVSSCAGTSSKDSDYNEKFEEKPVAELYNEAMDLLTAKNYKKAAVLFEDVDRTYPYSKWAVKAQVMSAYAYYEAGKYDDAIIAANRFIQLHPGNEDAAYAYYLRAVSYYEQISDVARDQKITMYALDALDQLVARFPESDYAKDARLKADLARDHLAGKEMSIGRYYLRQGLYAAALNRFQNVVTKHQTTAHVPEALHRLVETYVALGLIEEAKKYAAVLGHNYPNTKWYELSYNLATSVQKVMDDASSNAEDKIEIDSKAEKNQNKKK